MIVLETEAPYSFYTLLSMQQIVKFKEGSKAPITYLSDVIQTMKQHHLYNIILYDIVYYLKHEQTRQKYTQIY